MTGFTISPLSDGFSVRRSGEDESRNFSMPTPDGGMVETRFVRRVSSRFIVYISSMTGCDKACRFCWLTQTGQTMAKLLDEDEMVAQAETVLSASVFEAGEIVHFNFMARGEPLSNPAVDGPLFSRLARLANDRGLQPRIKVSTIMPDDFSGRDWSRFVPENVPVDIYYSLYSLDPEWRKRWIPKAMKPADALAELERFRSETGQRVILHWALIKGENDSTEDAERIGEAAWAAGLGFDFNLVRYNPANGKSAEAPDPVRKAYLEAISDYLCGGRIREIPRVGYDVAASCGMFLEAA
jgi:adenine C2-methylase RlmN of 23S rRNA A2503 and tRNA A37